MTNLNDKSELNEILQNFEDDEKPAAEKLWRESGDVPPRPNVKVSEHDTEQALKNVHHRIGVSDDNKSYSPAMRWRWLAAAAVTLLIIGSSYLLIPVTETVPYGKTATIELPDGSSVEMNSGSEIQYSRLFSYLNREIELDGEAYFRVEVESHPFTVISNNSVVEVTGTEFNIRSWSEEPGREVQVSVASGSVDLYPENARDKKVSLQAGMRSWWSADMEEPAGPEEVSIEDVTGWRENRLVFDNKPLWKIFREIERRFDVRIDIEDEQILNETLTTHYADPDDADGIIADISQVKGLRYSETANGFRIYRE